MQKLIITGNLTNDPELRATQTGTSVTNFTVAVNGRGAQQETTYFRVTAWNNLAENCSHYLKKGRKVCVVGEVGAEAYKASDGQPRAALKVTAHEVEFLSSKADDEPLAKQMKEQAKKAEPVEVETPTDLPF